MIDIGTETKLFSSAVALTPDSQTPTFRRPADRGYNTLDFADFLSLSRKNKEAPSQSSKGMLTVFLYIHPKVVFLQYHVSGVVVWYYGDDWMFTIHAQKIEDETKRTLPKLIKSVGHVEQYPNWDEWDDEEDEF